MLYKGENKSEQALAVNHACMPERMRVKLFPLLVSVIVRQLEDAVDLIAAGRLCNAWQRQILRGLSAGMSSSGALPCSGRKTGNVNIPAESALPVPVTSVARNGVCPPACTLHREACLKTKTEGKLSYALGRRQMCFYRICG